VVYFVLYYVQLLQMPFYVMQSICYSVEEDTLSLLYLSVCLYDCYLLQEELLIQ